MKRISITAACIVVVGVTGAAFASASYAHPPESGSEEALLASSFGPLPTTPAPGGSLLNKEIAVLTSQGISPARAVQSIDVQGKVARADIISKVEARMGSAFAGAWFEPAAARLHVGATSSKSRRTAERVIARRGLSAEVVVTAVRSTMIQLLATQKQWNRKLANLFARKEVRTKLEPQRNAVSVVLSSSVPSPERAALKREALAADVNVLTTVVPGQFGITPQAKTKCNKWVTLKAYCDPSITSGVSLLAEKVPLCTAGPLAINAKKQRFVLTAGHCITKIGQKWSAKNTKEEESVIGPVEGFVNGGKEGEKKGDYGDILIEKAWESGTKTPVFAVTALWKKMNEKKEETSYPVIGERKPTVGNTNCHVGQTSGESCGEIKALNTTFVDEEKAEKKFVEGMVEDTGPNLLSEGGDSGGPVVFIEASLEVLMEGTYTGDVYECAQVKGEVEGKQFFKTQTECQNFPFPEKVGNKGSWERKKYTCEKVAKGEGPKFFKTQADCEKGEPAGVGEWKREPDLHVVYNPLKQPVKGAAEGSLEALKLELITKANE